MNEPEHLHTRPHTEFERWLLPGLVTITLFLLNVIIFALVAQSSGGLTPEEGTASSIFSILVCLSFFWWIIESARWVIRLIRHRQLPKAKH